MYFFLVTGHRGHHKPQPPPPHPSPVTSRPPHPDPASPTFSDWVHEEGKNLKKKGNVYRVSNATAKKFPTATLPSSNKSVRFHEPEYGSGSSALDLQNGNVNSAEVIVNPHLCSPNGSLREGHNAADSGFVIANGYRPLSPQRGTGTLPLIKGNFKTKDGSFV